MKTIDQIELAKIIDGMIKEYESAGDESEVDETRDVYFGKVAVLEELKARLGL